MTSERSRTYQGSQHIMDGSTNQLEYTDMFYNSLTDLVTDPTNPNRDIVDYICKHREQTLVLYGGNNNREAEFMLNDHRTIPKLFPVLTHGIKNCGYKNIIIDRQTESFNLAWIVNMNTLGKWMLDNHPDVKVINISSSYNAPESQKWVTNIQLVGIAGFMYGVGSDQDDFKTNVATYTSEPRHRAMLNLNRLPKPARVFAMAKMSEADILKHSLTSMSFWSDIIKDWSYRVKPQEPGHVVRYNYSENISNMFPTDYRTEMLPYDIDRFSEIGQHIEDIVTQEIIDKKLDHKNWVLDDTEVASNNPAFHTPTEQPLFDQTWFSFVNETHTNIFFNDLEIKGDVFISEKTSKCFVHKHPFVLYAEPGALRQLNNMGFKTFSDIIDESYDLITDPVERMDACIAQAAKLCKYTDSQWAEVAEIIRPILDHNYKVLMSGTFKLFNFDKSLELM